MDYWLFLLVLSTITFGFGQVADRWPELYGQKPIPQPTKKAIIRHLQTLQASSKPRVRKTPTATPSSSAAAATSSQAGLSFKPTKPSTARVCKKSAPSTQKGKGKGKRLADEPDPHDLTAALDDALHQARSKHQDTRNSPEHRQLFGEIDSGVRPSLPRTAKPEPGEFTTTTSEDERESMLNDVRDTDDEDLTTVGNTPVSTLTPVPSRLGTPVVTSTPTIWTQNSPARSPTPAPESGNADFDFDFDADLDDEDSGAGGASGKSSYWGQGR